jgi:hypothetical protein
VLALSDGFYLFDFESGEAKQVGDPIEQFTFSTDEWSQRRLFSRNGKDFTVRFASIAKANERSAT